MRLCLAAFLLAVPVLPAAAAECSFPDRPPAAAMAGQTRFVNDCGQPYEIGYRLEGTTLSFPGGGSHTINDASPEAAERLLREAYGLIGEPDHLIRTKWPS
ncbi:hypothetical protein CKO38_05010 [Rhodospirillum rubrum]|uniref:hypothetical protein n=1 Tax=Rhodospirillum rubrum TaxID=1085 RepID=UPI0019074C91|nr:hypothetical protein [Rhodospirillum rubrum]MBK1664071.1 hypothetical protein [Rhodospirillum rubrum]MBK1676044.1 hypothetical protein [Rhodospirillum rubrum]